MNIPLHIIHVTHGDLDGVGCEVLSRAAYPMDTMDVYNEEYDTVNERLAHIIENCCFDILFITDISPRDEKVIAALNELSETKTIRLVDHHDTSADRFAGMDWAKFTTGKQCGTLAFFDTLSNEFNKDLSRYAKFALLVNDYDLWIKANPMSDKLNSLLSFYGKRRFVSRSLNHEYETEQYVMTVDEHKHASLYEQYSDSLVYEAVAKARQVNTMDHKNIVVVYADKHASQIGECVRQDKRFKDCHCTAIVNMANKMVSLRSIDPDFNVGLFAKSRGGGGNPKTAGFSFSDTKPLYFALGLLGD
jgi:oligoribonuclease NrnB/cAMP/cGMP phosphodiesterase (DHH superfamily)